MIYQISAKLQKKDYCKLKNKVQQNKSNILLWEFSSYNIFHHVYEIQLFYRFAIIQTLSNHLIKSSIIIIITFNIFMRKKTKRMKFYHILTTKLTFSESVCRSNFIDISEYS